MEILLLRCFRTGAQIKLQNGLSPLFVLAFPESLNTDALKTVLDVAQKLLLSDEALERFESLSYCFAILSCSRDNKLTQRFLQFERTRTSLKQKEAMDLYEKTLCRSAHDFNMQLFSDEIRPYVEVYSSEKVGAGKFYDTII